MAKYEQHTSKRHDSKPHLLRGTKQTKTDDGRGHGITAGAAITTSRPYPVVISGQYGVFWHV